jgi:hypothetical protein
VRNDGDDRQSRLSEPDGEIRTTVEPVEADPIIADSLQAFGPQPPGSLRSPSRDKPAGPWSLSSNSRTIATKLVALHNIYDTIGPISNERLCGVVKIPEYSDLKGSLSVCGRQSGIPGRDRRTKRSQVDGGVL